jgi:3-isopropylmalate/(R)-2-methylmalate dehydratase small subunit
MQKFTVHKGLVAPMDRENVDTDAIIPKQFLKSIRKTGFGPNLFDEWRYLDPWRAGHGPGQPQAQPGLRAEPAALRRRLHPAGAQELRLRLEREHAPWALDQYGFRAILAPSFADIFFNNCFKNGLLPIVLPESGLAAVRRGGGVPRLPAHGRPGAPGHRPARRRGDRLRRAALPQVLPAERLRRHRPDAAPADKIRAFEAERLAAKPWLAHTLKGHFKQKQAPAGAPVAPAAINSEAK